MISFVLMLMTAVERPPSLLPAITVAQANNPCENTDTVLPSDEMRELTLEQFGISVMIPENYRAILLNNGAVQIVDPGTYNLIRCEAMGGDPLGRGYSELLIRSESLPDDMSLEDRVRDDVYSEVPSNIPQRVNSCISPYPFADQQGYLVQTPTQRHAEFWLQPEAGPDVTVIETNCDCQGMVERLIEVLGRTTLLSSAEASSAEASESEASELASEGE
jgi:hypothetical protein